MEATVRWIFWATSGNEFIAEVVGQTLQRRLWPNSGLIGNLAGQRLNDQ
jgi:hypothetical protein